MTMGADHFEVDWEAMWREQLEETGKATSEGVPGAQGMGFWGRSPWGGEDGVLYGRAPGADGVGLLKEGVV